MLDPLIIVILTYLHVASAIGWLGGAVLFISVVTPGLKTLSPPASLEFLVKVAPKVTRFFLGIATATIVFGLALFFSLAGSFPGNGIYIGLSLGLIAYLIALGVTVPTFRKADRLAKEIMAGGQAGTAPAELAATMKRAGMAATIVVILLLLALIFMVSSGSGYY
ncbi:MAG: hypothetical protein OK438_08415 [Thaumarchaeota archaeon]|nr:hypothetical protein [Nitrososphaerota archaeon]